MSLLVHPHAVDAKGVALDITPESAGWTYVGFRVLKLAAGQTHDGFEDGREACLVILSGTVDISAGALHFPTLGGRASVFEGPATSLYLPANTAYRITATSDAEIAVCTAPGTGAGQPRVIAPGDVGLETRGSSNPGFIDSIYFRDPNGYVIELTCKREGHDVALDPVRNEARAKLERWQAGKKRTAGRDASYG